MPYIPFAARRIHAACATSAQPNIEFPRSMTQVDWEACHTLPDGPMSTEECEN